MTICVLHSIFVLVRDANPKRKSILLDAVGSSIMNKSNKLVMQLGKINNAQKSYEQRLGAVL